MSNPWRGEVALRINGQRCEMRLTLGALAELEAALQCGSLVELVARFENGQFCANDILALLSAGVSGGNCPVRPEDLPQAQIEGGPMAGARAAAELLARAFALPQAPD